MRTSADLAYACILKNVLETGDKLVTRNHEVYSHLDLPNLVFESTPLVSVRKTAWRKALLEMEWFMLGEAECPDDLKDWWSGQLSPTGKYRLGYGEQLRHYSDGIDYFDQVAFIQRQLVAHPNSRRLIMTTWHPADMARITDVNKNPNTPTCCHSTLVQFFVREGHLFIKSYQRSADLILGVSHNWIQSWAMLLWFAHNANLKPGTLSWVFGDAHIYTEESHLEAANSIISTIDHEIDTFGYVETVDNLTLTYNPKGDSSVFKASDFEMIGDIPEPVFTKRPKLL